MFIGEDSEYEGCESSSYEDPEDPNYIPSKDMESEESSGSSGSDRFDSNDFDAEPQISQMNPEQQLAAIKDINFLGERKLLSSHSRDHVPNLLIRSVLHWSTSGSTSQKRCCSC
ncbi:hypothetical protein AMECASPLE_025574 [Ameca splendens]|uniref:Uncharacterized protein n=1 Tax=Ameca splendens TaxID=208324 RepID=A0ABV1ABV5_9TELE